ncbi:hypothetical protein QP893_06240 [Corynebacterium pseudodiphtheriticum]|uniref:hypothetical protein n=1 Tax=Corynebacterium pseudodiphtheriticum TaxID=37637 RepID=UPI00254C9CAE|nr:hypothetical protein [Corynebacterium pseudodiphtheriticum]MDK8486997.1 hypothetical protein [Corynebacterium pseudodiphtheriticum]MDK8494379.1 hypothetical protein [Corynebacterium pseudodiphtheriticum]MDK8614364.1 hypothetical protein [Corynebacterium pseudodiphtheriticum]MDK8738302.1 hypothetical protein [Corynebacterium pseudodiphtheriticum]
MGSHNKSVTEREALKQSGLVLDVLGVEALEAVRDGDTTLNARHEQARLENSR